MKVIHLLFLVFFLSTSFLTCGRDNSKRKIKLTDQTTTRTDEQLTTTIHLEPTMRRAIAVMFFENKTGDQSLEWLQKGLTEMFIRALGQSQHLSVLSTDRLYEILERLGEESPDAVDMDMAAVVSQEANVEALVSGNISKDGDSLRINVTVHEPKSNLLKEESIEGTGLENIFGMVDHLTRQIKDDLQMGLGKEEPSRGIAELSTHSLEAWRHFTAGVDLRNKLFYADALNHFEKAIELDPSFTSAYLQLYPLLIDQGDNKRIMEVYQKTQYLKNKASQQEIYQIDLLGTYVNRDFRKAIDIMHEWVEQYPNDRDANYNLAHMYYGLHNYDQAIRYYQRVLDIDPNSKLVYNQLGYIYANTGNFSSAIETLERYKTMVPDEPNPYDSIGEIYQYQGEYGKAIKHFKQALNINQNFINALLHVGYTYLDQGKYSDALKTFSEYLEKSTDPATRATAHQFLGLTQWRLGNTDAAIEHYRNVYENTANLTQTPLRVYEIYQERNDSVSARQILEHFYNRGKNYIETNSDHIFSLAYLSLWYDLNVEETIRILEQWILTNEDQRQYVMMGHLMLSLLYMKTLRREALNRVMNQFSQDYYQDFLYLLREARNLSYSNVWKFYMLFNDYAYRHPVEGIEGYKRFIQMCEENYLSMPAMVFRLLLSDVYLHAGNKEKAREQLTIAGVPKEDEWMVIGSFDNKDGFNKRFPPEKKMNIGKKYKHQKRILQWQRYDDAIQEGYINFRQVFTPSNWSVAYGLIYVNSPDEKDVQIRIGSNEAVKLWLNEKLVWKFNLTRDAIFDDDITAVTLNPGLNKVLIKVCNRVDDWGFYFRITDSQGKGLPDIRFVSAEAVE